MEKEENKIKQIKEMKVLELSDEKKKLKMMTMQEDIEAMQSLIEEEEKIDRDDESMINYKKYLKLKKSDLIDLDSDLETEGVLVNAKEEEWEKTQKEMVKIMDMEEKG